MLVTPPTITSVWLNTSTGKIIGELSNGATKQVLSFVPYSLLGELEQVHGLTESGAEAWLKRRRAEIHRATRQGVFPETGKTYLVGQLEDVFGPKMRREVVRVTRVSDASWDAWNGDFTRQDDVFCQYIKPGNYAAATQVLTMQWYCFFPCL